MALTEKLASELAAIRARRYGGEEDDKALDREAAALIQKANLNEVQEVLAWRMAIGDVVP